MPRAGLCSVTLRALEPEQVVAAASLAGLSCLEWGADVHAPPEDPALVDRCRDACADSGLLVASYGTYWRAGTSTLEEARALMGAATRLGAPRLRVWAGELGSAEADESTWRRVTDALRDVTELAEANGLSIAVEHHPDTLSDTAAATLRLLEQVGSDALSTYWQPSVGQPSATALAELRLLLDEVPERLSAVHVFAWWPVYERVPLEERSDLWRPAIEAVASRAPEADVMLEFVPGDSPQAVVSESTRLLSWLGAGHGDGDGAATA